MDKSPTLWIIRVRRVGEMGMARPAVDGRRRVRHSIPTIAANFPVIHGRCGEVDNSSTDLGMSFLLTDMAKIGLSTMSTPPTTTTILPLLLTIGNSTNRPLGSPQARNEPCLAVATAAATGQNDRHSPAEMGMTDRE